VAAYGQFFMAADNLAMRQVLLGRQAMALMPKCSIDPAWRACTPVQSALLLELFTSPRLRHSEVAATTQPH
ncbi:hypothetical protein R5O87_18075, partial [Arthrobacter globiformis]|uniref:hypothetical protein n=1 Tax=Arthrobacter globiformis TaxID=1665 RepID=UPI003978B591